MALLTKFHIEIGDFIVDDDFELDCGNRFRTERLVSQYNFTRIGDTTLLLPKGLVISIINITLSSRMNSSIKIGLYKSKQKAIPITERVEFEVPALALNSFPLVKSS